MPKRLFFIVLAGLLICVVTIGDRRQDQRVVTGVFCTRRFLEFPRHG